MSGVFTEDDVIRRAQHLDLIYSQSRTLYDIIPQAPCPSNDKPQLAPGPYADGVIGLVSSFAVNQVAGKPGQLYITENLAPTTLAMTSTTFAQSTNVNLVKTSKYNQTGGRKNRNR